MNLVHDDSYLDQLNNNCGSILLKIYHTNAKCNQERKVVQRYILPQSSAAFLLVKSWSKVMRFSVVGFLGVPKT